MRLRNRNTEADYPAAPAAPGTAVVAPVRRFGNSWATVPLRVFLAAAFLFAGYAKLTYPGFLDPHASFGFRSAVVSAKQGTPIGGLMGPLGDHTSLFGHITAYAEIAIGLGLLVGLLTRLASLGGMVLTGLIVLSINWPSVKQYTGSGGWFTSVDLAFIAALSVFLLGGAGPLSFDRGISAVRARRAARDDGEPAYRDADAELEASRSRLRGDAALGGAAGSSVAAAGGAPGRVGEPDRLPEHPTEQLPSVPPAAGSSDSSSTSGRREVVHDLEHGPDSDNAGSHAAESDSLWGPGRTSGGQSGRADTQP
jgi:thiosulfate dehydrogenase [quinone] large subunit